MAETYERRPIEPMHSPTDDGVTAEDLGRVLFIGIGGVGMSGLARLYATRGLPVSGSELHDWPSLPELAALGATVHREHVPSNLDGVDTVVRSSAHPDSHLEIAEARRRGIRVYHRSEALAAAMTGRRSVVIAGTHGKTTTTAMTTEILEGCGLDPSYVNGGEASVSGSSGRHGTGDVMVIEADEHDRTFLRYRPHIAIITNIDADHLNNYGDIDNLEAGFAEFGRATDADGVVIVCADDERARRVGETLRAEGREVATYGTAADADLRIDKVHSTSDGVSYHATYGDAQLGEFFVPVPGAHLGLNSAAAVLAALRLGLEADRIRTALAAFSGVRRRFELRGTVGGVRVYDEYAYHPTAMKAALSTLSGIREGGRLIVVFQPYRAYRTRDLRAEIAEALAIADQAVVMEVFGPGEDIPVSEGGIALHAAVALPEEDKVFVPDWNDVPGEVAARARPGDLVVTMGAPPLSLMPPEILAALGGPSTT
ncbi:UDP-N-acetylmuramate--alanine ligase [Phytomonospora endophytica]|uniref:UDP-N-acetylmuramate--L-alanine ligase n=2 Tax=Phytomonospora endophytica TaxID=714109 RepID=A0A841FJE8_9ACTN|nr:UDP-N-acetylmuramate--alanine ligase [Phytomonospora endophytica]GIG66082.1 UDP-N-acetylmuramate--L-alanine ligase [Phytomonospora endophytica]